MPDDLATLIARLGIDWQSWIRFADETIVGVAILAFGFTFLLYLSVTLSLWWRGAQWTKADLYEQLFLSLFGSTVAAIFLAGGVAFLGWPAMQLLDLSAETQTSVISFLKLSYITVSGVTVIPVAMLALLVWETKKASQPRLGRVIASALDIWWAEAWYRAEKQNQFVKLVNDPDTTPEQIEQMRCSADDVVLAVIAEKALRDRFPGWRAAPQKNPEEY